MAKKSITKNYIYHMFFEILKIVVPLITTPYLSRVLGAENIGIYSYTLSITTYFILFGSLGVALYGQREIAYLQENKHERSKTFYEILIMRFITLGISLLIFYIGFIANGQYSMYYKILLLEILANSIDISWFFQGLEEFKKTVLRNSLVKIISVICIFVFVKTQNDLVEYFFIYVISTLLGNVSLWMYLPKYVEKVKVKELKIFRHLKPTIGLFIPQVAVQVYTVLDKTMIGAFIEDKSEVGFYEQAQKIVKLLLTIATSLGTVMIPRMASTFASGDNEKLKEYMKRSFSFVLLLAFPLMFGMISVSNKFVPIFYGAGYEKVIYLISIISPILLAIGLSNVVGQQYLLPTRQQKKYTISVTVGAIVNFILNIIFIQIWKSIGASIATVIAECTVTGIQFYLVRNEFRFIDVLKIAKKYFIASIAMFAISILIGIGINNNLISILLQASISCIVYFGLLVIMKDKLVHEGINLVKSKILKSRERGESI
ncbi:MAG: flippase [Clostridia bacterium]|nr:flippase [Clostridia bacterium]